MAIDLRAPGSTADPCRRELRRADAAPLRRRRGLVDLRHARIPGDAVRGCPGDARGREARLGASQAGALVVPAHRRMRRGLPVTVFEPAIDPRSFPSPETLHDALAAQRSQCAHRDEPGTARGSAAPGVWESGAGAWRTRRLSLSLPGRRPTCARGRPRRTRCRRPPRPGRRRRRRAPLPVLGALDQELLGLLEAFGLSASGLLDGPPGLTPLLEPVIHTSLVPHAPGRRTSARPEPAGAVRLAPAERAGRAPGLWRRRRSARRRS